MPDLHRQLLCSYLVGGNPLMRTLLQAVSHVTWAQLLHLCCNTVFIQATLTLIPWGGSVMRTMLQYCIYTSDSSTHTLWGKPLMRTLLWASSHMSHELSFHTCAAILYSSIRGSCNIQTSVKCTESEITYKEEKSVFWTTSNVGDLTAQLV
jgi:hypothetical protein